MKKEEKARAVVEAVVALYLETGNDQTIKEIAAKMGLSEGSVRAALGDLPDELYCRDDVRQSFSKDYRMFTSGAHKVSVYGPTRDALRTMLLKAK